MEVYRISYLMYSIWTNSSEISNTYSMVLYIPHLNEIIFEAQTFNPERKNFTSVKNSPLKLQGGSLFQEHHLLSCWLNECVGA